MGQPALAIHFRDPSDFITSVIEHHRGNPLPRSEEEKTYLVFIGVDGEGGIFEMIDNRGYLPAPKPNEEQFEKGGISEIEDEGNKGNGEGDKDEEEGEGKEGEGGEPRYEEVNDWVASSSEIGDEQGTPSPIVERVRRFPRQMRVHQDGPIRGIHNIGERRCKPNIKNLEEGEGCGDDREGVGKQEQVFEEYGDEDKDQGAGGANEPSTYEVLEEKLFLNSFQPIHLRPQGGEKEYEWFDAGVGGRLGGTKYDGGGGHDEVNQDKEGEPDKDNRREGERASGDSRGNIEEAKYPPIHKSYHCPHTASQGGKGGSLALSLPNASPMSSLLSSPPREEEEQFSGATRTYGEQEGPNRISSKAREEREEYSAGKTGKSEEQKEHSEVRDEGVVEKGKVDEGEAEELYAANTNTPQTPTHCQLVLPIREPGSPIPPRPDEISPLTTSKYSYLPPGSYEEEPQGICEGELNSAEEEDNFYGMEEGSRAEIEEPEENKEEYALYPGPVLEILAAAENVEIIYISDLKGLRAFLHVLQYSPATASYPPLLAIWGLIGAHHSTDEFGGEGIGNTLSLAVDAATASGRLLVLGEGYVPLDEAEWGGAEVHERSWMDAEVPILNRGSMVVGGTVVVKNILGRWCRFGEDFEE